MKRVCLAMTVALLTFATGASAADEKSSCLVAYERGQRAKLDGKLAQAREHFLECASDACPAALRPDCAKWLDEVTSALATVLVRAHDASGNEVLDVAVYEGDKLIAPKLTGRALSFDPGLHTLRFQFANGTSVSRDVIIHEGERAIPVDVFVAGAPRAPEPTPVATVITSRPVPATVFVFGGVAVAGLVGAGYFAITGRSEQFAMMSECRPYCSSDRVSSVKTDYIAADISLLVGLASGAFATYFFATRPTVTQPVQSAKLGLSVTPNASRVEATFRW